MTTYRLYPTNPALATGSFSGTFMSGIGWYVTQGGMWFQGYWWYVPTSGQTAAQKFCLYCFTSSSAGTVVPGSVVTSGTLTAGTWNYVPLATPIQLATANPYLAATGFTANGVFPAQNNQFNSGGPFAAGITNGPLFAFGDPTAGGTNGNPWGGVPQGTFATTSTDPTTHMPLGGSNSANFGLDVQVSDTAPPGFTGPFRLYPSTTVARAPAVADSAVPYGVATEVICNQACTLPAIWYYSPSGATVTQSWCGVWDVATKTIVQQQLSPSWSGAAAAGWLRAALPSPAVLTPGKRYKLHVAVYTNSVASAKDASDPWGPAGKLKNGIATVPVTAPPLSNASDAYNYNNNPGGTPPYSDGTHLTHGQSTFSQTVSGFSGTPPYPLLWANAGSGSGTQDYFVDAEFYLISGSGLLIAGIV